MTASEEDTLTIEAKPRVGLPVRLVGKDYRVKPLKGAVGMNIAKQFSAFGESAKKDSDNPENQEKMSKLMSELVKMLFGKDAAAVTKRLNDPEDDLDFEHIMELVQLLTQRTTGNPTT